MCHKKSNIHRNSNDLLVGMNTTQDENTDDNVNAGVGKRQRTLFIRNVGNKRVAARRVIIAVFLSIIQHFISNIMPIIY